MQLDLRLLKQMHPLLPDTVGADYVYRAAIALDRQSHKPATPLDVLFLDRKGRSSATRRSAATLDWEWCSADEEGAQLDRHRVTEDGAEGVALALVGAARRWVIRRRLQRGEFADWLLIDPQGRLVALEVSGIDGSYKKERLEEKWRQVQKVSISSIHVVCIVAFGPPTLHLVEG